MQDLPPEVLAQVLVRARAAHIHTVCRQWRQVLDQALAHPDQAARWLLHSASGGDRSAAVAKATLVPALQLRQQLLDRLVPADSIPAQLLQLQARALAWLLQRARSHLSLLQAPCFAGVPLVPLLIATAPLLAAAADQQACQALLQLKPEHATEEETESIMAALSQAAALHGHVQLCSWLLGHQQQGIDMLECAKLMMRTAGAAGQVQLVTAMVAGLGTCHPVGSWIISQAAAAAATNSHLPVVLALLQLEDVHADFARMDVLREAVHVYASRGLLVECRHVLAAARVTASDRIAMIIQANSERFIEENRPGAIAVLMQSIPASWDCGPDLRKFLCLSLASMDWRALQPALQAAATSLSPAELQSIYGQVIVNFIMRPGHEDDLREALQQMPAELTSPPVLQHTLEPAVIVCLPQSSASWSSADTRPRLRALLAALRQHLRPDQYAAAHSMLSSRPELRAAHPVDRRNLAAVMKLFQPAAGAT